MAAQEISLQDRLRAAYYAFLANWGRGDFVLASAAASPRDHRITIADLQTIANALDASCTRITELEAGLRLIYDVCSQSGDAAAYAEFARKQSAVLLGSAEVALHG